VNWPANAKQKSEKLSIAGFFYTGKSPFINKRIFVIRKIFFFSKNTYWIRILTFVTGKEYLTTCFHCGISLKERKGTDDV
jgi:hypothetical protein